MIMAASFVTEKFAFNFSLKFGLHFIRFYILCPKKVLWLNLATVLLMYLHIEINDILIRKIIL